MHAATGRFVAMIVSSSLHPHDVSIGAIPTDTVSPRHRLSHRRNVSIRTSVGSVSGRRLLAKTGHSQYPGRSLSVRVRSAEPNHADIHRHPNFVEDIRNDEIPNKHG
jgi:hypothetical protein